MEHTLGFHPPIIPFHFKTSIHFLPRCTISCSLWHTLTVSSLRARLPRLDGIFIDHDSNLENLGTADYEYSLSPYDSDADDYPIDDSKIIKTRNKHIWIKPGMTIDDAHSMTHITTKDDWTHETKYAAHSQNIIWAHRKQAIEEVLKSNAPAAVLTRVQERLDQVDYGTILRRLATQRKWSKQHQVFEWMKQHVKLTPPCFTTYISSMGKAGYPIRALQAFKNQSDRAIRINVIVCNSLFKALIVNGKVDAAFLLFDHLKLEGLTPNMETYKVLLSGCAKHRSAYTRAESFLQEMAAIGLQPDSFVFSSLLNVCAAFGLEEEAKSVLEKMEKAGVSMNRYHYCALLNLYAETQKSHEAEKLFLEIQERHVRFDRAILCNLMKVYRNSGLLAEARNIFDAMERFGFPPDESAYCIMMDSYAKSGNVKEAHYLFQEMKARGLKFGCYSYCILISSYSKMGRVDAIELLVEELNNRPRESLDIVFFNNLLKTYCQLGIMEGILKTMKMMDEEKVAPDRATFNILISFFCKEELFDLAKTTLHDLMNQGMHPNVNSYTPIVLELVKTGNLDRAVIAYNEMRNFGIAPSLLILEALIESSCKSKRMEDAVRFLKDLKENDLLLQSGSLEFLLISIGENTQLIREVFKAVDPLNLEGVNFDTVLMSYGQHGCLDAVREMLELMGEYGFQASKEVVYHLGSRLIKGHTLEDSQSSQRISRQSLIF